MSDETFSTVSDFLKQVKEIPVSDKHGLTRSIGVRFTHQYPLENNEWGEFQAHRRVLGVVSVGSCANQIELHELCRLHEAVKNKFVSTLFDSRCVVLCEGKENGVEEEIEENGLNEDEEISNETEVDKPPSWFQPSNHKTRLLQFHGAKYTAALKADIQDFIASLFWILESKRVDWSREGGERSTLLCAPFERKDFVGLDMESRNNKKRVLGRQKKHLGDLSLLAGLPAEAWNYYQVGCDILRPANDWLWLAGCLEGLCAVSILLQERQEKGVSIGAVGLSWEEIIDKYRECVNHYAKYKHAGIIETEASLKAVMILIKYRRHLLASEFLQNIVYINLQLSDQEKIQRFIALSSLYKQLGFHRKAAFFQRVAAMRCVAPQNPNQDWSSCYSLMLAAVEGYQLDLNRADRPTTGWPTLQVQLLQELVGTSRKMGAHAASTRHMTFLFQCMFPWLSISERQDFSTQLSVLSQRAQPSTAPLPLNTFSNRCLVTGKPVDVVLPQVNLNCLPQVASVEAVPHKGNLTPYPAPVRNKVITGPFLFTPIQNFGGGSARSSGRSRTGGRSATWVQGDQARLCLTVHNTLGVEVKISNISLIFDGVDLEVGSGQTVLLDSHPDKQTVIVETVPRANGNLRILGYCHTVLGVRSLCHFKDIPGLEEEFIKVDVIGPLPVVELSCERKVMTTGGGVEDWEAVESLSIYAGEELTLRLTVRNQGTVPVCDLDMRWEAGEDGEAPEVIVDLSTIPDHLPLLPGSSFHLSFKLRGINNQNYRGEDCVSIAGSDSRWSATGFNSLQSRLSHPSSLPSQLAVPGAGSGNPSLLSHLSEISDTSNTQLRWKAEVKGEEQEWCRRAEVALNLTQMPSIAISRWDVLPGERVENCFLVLDLLNRTGEEMELTYAGKKQLQIETGDVCRVPVPVEKCSFSESLDWREGGEEVTQYMQERVHLAWTIGEEELRRTGSACLSSVLWTEVMVEQLRRPPLSVTVLLNDQECVEGRDTEARLAQLLEIQVVLENSLLEPVEDTEVLVRLLQENTGMAAVGSAGSSGLRLLGEIGAGERAQHACSLLPLSPGTYSLLVSVSLKFRSKIHAWKLPQLSINVAL